VNTLPDHADRVRKAIEELGIETMSCTVGGPARLADEALF